MQVYLLTNTVTEKLYVGQTTVGLKHRWGQHKSDTKRMRGPHHLVHSMRKHGHEVFTMELLHECETKEEMDFVEMFYIAFLNTKSPNGYNLTDGGDGTQGRSGWKASEETKAKLRGRTPWKGKHHTAESIAKMRVSAKGRKATPEARKNMSIAMGGWQHGTSTGYGKYKCRCELCKKWQHDSHVAKFGVKTKEETRIKLSESHKGIPAWNKGTAKGVYWDKEHQKWAVVLWIDGKTKRFGRFANKEEAEAKALEMRRNPWHAEITLS